MKRVLVFINGILTFPGSAENWTGRAVTWTHIHSECRGEKVEYYAGPIDRVFRQKARAEKLFSTIDRYRDGWTVDLVGHSNGCDVICDMFRDNPEARANTVHLVCGASESSFKKNGLNAALGSWRASKVVVYMAGRDKALKLAHTLPGHILGYGTIGLDGPKDVDTEVAPRVQVVRWPEYAHSDCWADSCFDFTMSNFL